MKLLICLLCLIAPCTVLLGQTAAHLRDARDAEGRSYFESGGIDNFALCLKRMKEPSLRTRYKYDASTSIRWTWLRSFHAPISVRITKSSGRNAFLTVTELTGKVWGDPGSISSRKTMPLSDVDWQKILAWSTAKEFWASLTSDEQASMLIRDGSIWVLEYSTPKQYELLTLPSPSAFVDRFGKSGLRSLLPYVDMGRFFLNLSGLVIPESEFY
jgi:hypothetical protein